MSFGYVGAILWNLLPSSLKDVNNLIGFKYALKRHILV